MNPNLELIRKIGKNDIEQVRLLLQIPQVNPAELNNTAIQTAARNGYTEIIELLLRDGRADPAVFNNVTIVEAAAKGYTEIVRLLLQDGRVDPATNNNVPIKLATANGHLEVVRLLLQDDRVDPTATNSEIIRLAAEKGHIEIIRLLLQDGRVNPNIYDGAAIRIAAQNDHTETVMLLATIPGLLTSAVNYNLKNRTLTNIRKLAIMTGSLSDSDEDLLVWAAAVGSRNLVRQLINIGVDPTFANNSAVIAAQQYGNVEVMKYLLTLPGVHL